MDVKVKVAAGVAEWAAVLGVLRSEGLALDQRVADARALPSTFTSA